MTTDCLLRAEAGGKKQCVCGKTLTVRENTAHSWVWAMTRCLHQHRTTFPTAQVQEGLLIAGLDYPAGKGLRVRVIKDLNCHVDCKLGNRLCRVLNKSALDLWPNLIQQKIISAAY